MDRCNATRDLSPCNNCNGPECSERIRQPETNREWLNGLSNKQLCKIMFRRCPPGRHSIPSICGPLKMGLCENCWAEWLGCPAESEE